MAMVEVGVVRMLVPQRLMTVPVRMRLADRPVMDMLVVFVVDMGMLVFAHLVSMFVVMTFGQVQP